MALGILDDNFGNVPKLKKYSGAQIKKIRNREDVTRQRFAAYLNITYNTLYQWERGINKPSHIAFVLLNLIDRHGLGILNPDW